MILPSYLLRKLDATTYIISVRDAGVRMRDNGTYNWPHVIFMETDALPEMMMMYVADLVDTNSPVAPSVPFGTLYDSKGGIKLIISIQDVPK